MIGAIWGKWDLHIHSPYTHQNNQFAETSIDEYVDKLSENQISVIGLTNYFYFENNELEIIRSKILEKRYEITVLGNLEFRITQPNKTGDWINVHCIFSEHLSTKDINLVMSRLECHNTNYLNQKIYCCPESIKNSRLKLDSITVDFKKLLDHISSNFTLGKDYLIAVCPNGYGGFRPDHNEGRSIATAIEIEKFGQLILGRSGDQDFFLNFLDRYEGAVAKPVFECSDSHSLNGIGEGANRSPGVGEKYSWVKAKPTFEGLRQCLIEPKSRVQLKDDFVERTYLKPKFKYIHVKGSVFQDHCLRFNDQVIPLNPNMVSIIGGRGTGKSLLLDAIRSLLKTKNTGSFNRNVSASGIEISVDQGDGTEIKFTESDQPYSYLHVSQGDVKKYSENPDELSEEIKRMLGIHHDNFDNVISDEIIDNISRYRSFIEYWTSVDSAGNSVNTPEFQKKIIQQHTQLIQTLTSPQNKQLIEQYQKNITSINLKQSSINDLNRLQGLIYRHLSEINQGIEATNTNDNITEKIPVIGSDITSNKIQNNIQTLKNSVNDLTESNSKIITTFQKQGFNQDISSLLTKVSESQSAIDAANSKLIEIKKRTDDYQLYVQKRCNLIRHFYTHLIEQKNKIDSAFNSLREKQPQWSEDQNELVSNILRDIQIEGLVTFNSQSFYDGIQKCVNLGKFRSTQNASTIDRLTSTFNVLNINDFFQLVGGENKISCEGNGNLITLEDFLWKYEYFNQGGRFELLNYLYSPESLKNFLHVNAVFEYKDKTVKQLSVGQRGTFYVCLKLATDPFGSPFVFDQPEDDLDNDFIMNQLVPLFSKIKKYRQVIIVTHNANLVVNTDSEQIIVAKNENEIISYDSGALEEGSVIESTGIRSAICNILEGGSYAFEKRERKYGIQSH